MRPIIYVDVDGVLNFDRKTAHSRDYLVGKDHLNSDKDLTVRLDSRHGPWLLELADKAGAELVWATSWQGMANEHIGPRIGLPWLPFVPLRPREFSEADTFRKVMGVCQHHEDRPFAWFDDDFMLKPYLNERIRTPFLLHEVYGYVGLTEKDIDIAYRWLKDL